MGNEKKGGAAGFGHGRARVGLRDSCGEEGVGEVVRGVDKGLEWSLGLIGRKILEWRS